MYDKNKYEPIIGLEVHVELKTKTKMFCGCSANYYNEEPNKLTCPTCLGLPGALPVINKQAIQWCVLIGVALGCKIPLESKFDRKNYFYPDLPKGYQISQYDSPFAVDGEVVVEEEGKKKTIGIERVHQEEDTGKLIHSVVDGEKCTLIDFNRSGVPLVEIVTRPDLRSSKDAKIYLQNLQKIIRYLGVSDCDMEKGSMRLEPNISVRKLGTTSLPDYKVEVKNINSFKFVEKAIEYEIERQIDLLEKGERIPQETRGYDSTKNATFTQRSKENAQDYRYFPEPDLPPVSWTKDEIVEIKKLLPELPSIKTERFIKDYKLTPYDSLLLTEEKETADWFEEALQAFSQTTFPGIKEKSAIKIEKSAYAKPLANWMNGELKKYMNQHDISLEDLSITPAHLSELLYLLDVGTISGTNAKLIFSEMLSTGATPSSIITQKNLSQTNNENEIEEAVKKILDANPKAVQDYKAGKTQVLGFLLGLVMRETGGKANAAKVKQIIERLV